MPDLSYAFLTSLTDGQPSTIWTRRNFFLSNQFCCNSNELQNFLDAAASPASRLIIELVGPSVTLASGQQIGVCVGQVIKNAHNFWIENTVF